MNHRLIIEKNIEKYLIFSEESILNALKKISENKSRLLFSVDESGRLKGILTDGDVRRWLITQKDIDLNHSIKMVVNRNYKFVTPEADHLEIQKMFSEKIEFLPMLDLQGRILAIVSAKKSPLFIGPFEINSSSPVLTIAEIGINHNGSLDNAKKLITAAKKSGADCVKFQMRDMSSLYRNSGKNSSDEDLGVQYTIDLLSKFELAEKEMYEIFDTCNKQNILALCTPWDLRSLERLEKYGMPAYKVASADLTYHDMLRALGQTGKPLICSTGMSTESEIIESVRVLKEYHSQFVLLHCNSTYPVPLKDVHLNYMTRLREISEGVVGYSGHERGYEVTLAAVALGAKIIEKHFTLDKNQEGNDHKVSLLPDEFSSMVKKIRNVEESLGVASQRRISQGELMNRNTLAKSIVATCKIKPGEVIAKNMIEVKSPGRGLQPNHKDKLLGLKALREFKPGDFFFLSDIEKKQVTARPYQVKRPWGVPVRYHDFKNILPKSNLDFIEFHLSYKDMDLRLEDYFEQTYDLDYTVHSPDLFSGDHLLDLCAENKTYRQRSIDELKRVVETTHRLKPYFSRATKPMVIVSVGGSSKSGHLPAEKRKGMYDVIAESLSQIDTGGLEIIPQTLPPFPWYFGGQLYLNLFVDPADSAKFCKDFGYRLCFDISHSKLACNHYNWSFSEFLDLIAPHSAHLHIADSEGVDGEGLQVGEGDIDFLALLEKLNLHCPEASFLPEIWQGHVNEGEGFWLAMERLEKMGY